MSIHVRLDKERVNGAFELDELTRAAAGDGGIVTFVGLARNTNHSGAEIEKLVLDHHPRLTLASLEQIASDAATRFEVSHVRVVHRCGDIQPSEVIVFAGAAAVHRRAAFEAADYLMDRLKTEAVFWKREDGPRAQCGSSPPRRTMPIATVGSDTWLASTKL